MIIALKLRDRLREMESLKLALAMVCAMVLTSLIHICQAQDSPQEFVDAHNKVRTNEGVDPLVWDEDVADYAQKYANLRQADCKPQHSDSQSHNYGENIVIGPESETTAEKAVQYWYAEKENYDRENYKCLKGVCGHYTQLVWLDTVSLGCARVQCSSGQYFITCNYFPAGNIDGEVPF